MELANSVHSTAGKNYPCNIIMLAKKKYVQLASSTHNTVDKKYSRNIVLHNKNASVTSMLIKFARNTNVLT